MIADRFERVVLELDPGDPISGRICCSPGPVETFRGWVELASRLEHLRPGGAGDTEAGDPNRQD